MPRSEIDLPGYVGLLWRRKWAIFIGFFVVTASAVVFSSAQTRVYEARADLLFPATEVQANNPGAGIPTDIQILYSQPVRDAVKARLGVVPTVSAAQVGVSNLVQIRARSIRPRQAALFANTYANAYMDYRTAAALQSLHDTSGKVQAELADLQKEIDGLDAQLRNAPATGLVPAAQAAARQRDTLLLEQQSDRQLLDQLQLDAAGHSGVQLITPAPTPGAPVKPKPLRTGALGAAVGLMLGVGWALMAERFDDALKSKEEVEEVAVGVPVVGLVPAYGSRGSHRQQDLVMLSDPTSPAAEAYRAMQMGLQIMAGDRPLGTVQVTSPVGGDGKTTTLANLAVALAEAGEQVVVVGCDLRRPLVHRCFGLANDVGLTSVLLHGVPLASALQPVPGHERLLVLGSGPKPAKPLEVLSSRELIYLLEALQQHGHMVLIDSPPVLPVTDAAVLSARVDAVLLVTRIRATTSEQLRRAIEVLRQVDAPLAGVVVNAGVDKAAPVYRYRDTAPAADDGGSPTKLTPARLRPAPARPAPPEAAGGPSARITAPEPDGQPPVPSIGATPTLGAGQSLAKRSWMARRSSPPGTTGRALRDDAADGS